MTLRSVHAMSYLSPRIGHALELGSAETDRMQSSLHAHKTQRWGHSSRPPIPRPRRSLRATVGFSARRVQLARWQLRRVQRHGSTEASETTGAVVNRQPRRLGRERQPALRTAQMKHPRARHGLITVLTVKHDDQPPRPATPAHPDCRAARHRLRCSEQRDLATSPAKRPPTATPPTTRPGPAAAAHSTGTYPQRSTPI
jgi:hypothetical protein